MKLNKSLILGLLVLGCGINGLQAVSIQNLIDQNKVPSVRLKTLNLSNLGIDNLEGLKNLDLRGVKYLSLSGNNLRILPKHAFKKVRGANGLWGLDLSNNNLEEIAPKALAELKNLQVIILNNNNLESISDKGLGGLSRLRFLAVHRNPMSLEAAKALQKQVPRAFIWNWPVTKERLVKAGLIAAGLLAVVLATIKIYKGQAEEESFEFEQVWSPGAKKIADEVRWLPLLAPRQIALSAAWKASEKDFSSKVEVIINDPILVEALILLTPEEDRERVKEILLLKAAGKGAEEVVEFLIGRNANMDAQDENGNTALIEAVSQGHLRVLNLLLDRGADVNAQNYDGNTALHIAALKNNQEMIRALLAHDANVDIKNKKGRTASYYTMV